MNQLDQLKQFTTAVADTGDFEVSAEELNGETRCKQMVYNLL